jgi:hypothetical protein
VKATPRSTARPDTMARPHRQAGLGYPGRSGEAAAQVVGPPARRPDGRRADGPSPYGLAMTLNWNVEVWPPMLTVLVQVPGSMSRHAPPYAEKLPFASV